ncbi:MAG TPA: nucleotidyl transferase AbiEii/AbiGii toxin family protein [Kofleriaceae bacterium]
MTFAPRLDALPPPQRALWPELAAVPRRYVLYGGTALALRFAHRPSVDFDFFAHDHLDHRELETAVPFVRGAIVLDEGPDTRTILVTRAGGDIKVSFFGGIAFGRVGDPEATDDGVLRAASLLDLAGTKIKALLQRVEAKDYRDVAALLEHGMKLEDILGSARVLFGLAFNPLIAQKTLCYFEGGDLESLTTDVRGRLLATAGHDVTPSTLTLRSPRLD